MRAFVSGMGGREDHADGHVFHFNDVDIRERLYHISHRRSSERRGNPL